MAARKGSPRRSSGGPKSAGKPSARATQARSSNARPTRGTRGEARRPQRPPFVPWADGPDRAPVSWSSEEADAPSVGQARPTRKPRGEPRAGWSSDTGGRGRGTSPRTRRGDRGEPADRGRAGAFAAGERPARSEPPPTLRWGTHPVREAIDAGVVRELWLASTETARHQETAERAISMGIEVHVVTTDAIERMTSGALHQGAVARVRPFRYRDLTELPGIVAAQDRTPIIVMLDGIEDPQNLGAVLRSADGAGVAAVIVPSRRTSPVTAAVARSSAGAVDTVPVIQVANLTTTLQALKRDGYWVYGLDGDAQGTYSEATFDRPTVIVAGAEGKGLSRLVAGACDALIRIPLLGRLGSLNVSVATAVVLFEARRGGIPMVGPEEADEG